ALSQLFKFLCYLSQAGIHCIFVYDGKERSKVKRGRRVNTREPNHYTQARTLIEAFGFYTHTAPAEADAELAEMCKRGLIHAVLTKDSDLLPFGAPRIFRPVYLEHKPRTFKDFEQISMYSAETIESELEISHAGVVLISLFLGSDFGDGVNGIGPETALGLAKCGYGESLLDAYHSFSTMPAQLAVAFAKINDSMATELEYNTHQKLKSCSVHRANVLRISQFPSLQDLATLSAFLEPVTSWTHYYDPSKAPTALRWPPRIPSITEITVFCCEILGWPSETVLRRFHNELWPAVVVRML
ncbi:PIN domain-like protein, partial [Lentinula raphanica]